MPLSRPNSLYLAALLLVGGLPFAHGESVEISSPMQRVALVELYTSEGCSSCPPADRWLSRLRDEPGLWKSFAPIAFHVDYWDYIGWKDRFASADYSSRQRRYAFEGGTEVVYTPGFFQDGQEWRGWRTGESPQNANSEAGVLRLTINEGEVDVHFADSGQAPDELMLQVALLGMDLTTHVRRGENQGRTLRHNFVALGLNSAALQKSDDGYRGKTTLPDSSVKGTSLAVVAWVSRPDSQAPIQSVGGFLPER